MGYSLLSPLWSARRYAAPLGPRRHFRLITQCYRSQKQPPEKISGENFQDLFYEKTAQDLSGVVAREVTMLEHIERYKT